jgi:hypothetical protein
MNREDDFVKILKDCWIGREYKSRVDPLVIKVVDDNGKCVTYQEGLFSQHSAKSIKGSEYVVTFVESKERLKSYLEIYQFVRTK